MKTMSCKQLGGACDKAFQDDTFDKIFEKSKQHGMEMYRQQDKEHLEAMGKIQKLMQQPEAMKQTFESKKMNLNHCLKIKEYI